MFCAWCHRICDFHASGFCVECRYRIERNDERAAMIAEIDVVAEEIARSYARLPGPAQAAAIRLGSSLSALRRALVSTATYP